jgi:hypothetical protein
MKIILPASNYTYTPSLNRVDFSPMGASFDSKRLLAIINIKTGKTIYATGSSDAGLGGTFSGSLLTYASSNAGQLASDPIQVFYDDELAIQQVSGTVSIAGTVVVDEPVTIEGSVGSSKSVPSAIYDGSGTFPILSTPDPLTGREGLDINLQSSSYGGLLNNPLPLPYQNQALSVGYINGGNLVSPALDPVSNELLVKSTAVGITAVNISSTSAPVQVDLVTNSAGVLETNLNLSGNPPATGLGVTGSATLRTSSNTSFEGVAAATGAGSTTSGTQRVVLANDATVSTDLARYGGAATSLGQKAMSASMPVVLPSDQTVPVSMADLFITGASGQTLAGNNALLSVAGTGSTDASGFRSCFVQVVSTATAGNYTFECSADGTNFVFMPVVALNSTNGTVITAAITATASSLVYAFPISARFIRLRISSSLTGGSIQCFTRLSPTPYQPIFMAVAQSAAANLNSTVSGSLTGVTTVTTVSTVTQSNSALPASVTDVASAALTTTTTTATLTPTGGIAFNVVIPVTATSGTNQTLDVSIEVSDDSGTNWVKVYDFPRITATGVYRSGPLKMLGNRIRYVQTVGGTSPSFTRSIVRLQRSDTIFTRFVGINRTIDPNTLSSTTPAIYCEGASAFNFYARVTAQTTPATIQLQFSDNGSAWFDDVGSTLTTAVGIVHAKADNEQWRFVRAVVSAAGSGITLGEMVIKGVRE